MKTLEEIKAILKEHKEEVRQKYKSRLKGVFGYPSSSVRQPTYERLFGK